jgi:hypothetical protein
MDMDMELNQNKLLLEYNDVEEEKGSRFWFLFLLVGVFFGVLFYDFLGFDFLDELMALVLALKFGVGFLLKRTRFAKPVFVVFFISIFYLIYSFKIHSNVKMAIIYDYASQIKPYIGFFCTLALMPHLDAWHKAFLRKFCWVLFFILLVIGVGGYKVQFLICGHPSRYATCVVICSMLYLYCSELSWGFFWRATLMAGIGLLSGRSKFFGFFALYELLLFMKLKGYDFKWRVRDIVTGMMVLGVMLLVSWQKIVYYFIDGAFKSDQTFARPALYMTAYDIFLDYFPFGCGFGSFATNASAIYYSSIYEEYGIDRFHGLSEDFPDFIADTYYPALAQFGIVGVVLFIWFFVYIYRKMKQIPAENTNLRILVLMGIFFFLIESTSDSTFTHNRGFMFFVLMGLSVAEGIRLRERSADPPEDADAPELTKYNSK